MRKFLIPAISVAALAASGFAIAQTTGDQPTQNQPTAEQCAADPQLTGCPGATGNEPAQPDATQPDAQTGQQGTTDQMPSDTQTGQQQGTEQQPGTEQQQAEQPPVQVPPDLTVTDIDSSKAMLASYFIGSTVYSTANENIGDINDLVFDAEGKVNAAVIGVGGFLGMGEKDVAVPLNKITMTKDENGVVKYVIAATREQLDAAPGFDKTRMTTGDEPAPPPAQPAQ